MGTIVGRQRELDRLSAFLSPGDPVGALLIEGEAGIGKSTLWRAGLETAASRGFRVLATTAAAAEARLSYTGLRDVLVDAFDEVEATLPEPQRQALAATLLLEEPAPTPPAPSAIAVAASSTLRALGAATPTIVAIDDIQWLDSESAAVIAFVLRRADHAHVRFLLARRSDEPAVLAADRVEVLRPAPLSAGALGLIIHEELGFAYPRPTLQRLHEISGGNAFFALELAHALGHAPGPLLPGEPVPVPASLRELVRGRVRELPTETLEALTLAAAAGAPALELLDEAVGGDSSALLEPARAAGLVTLDLVVRFSHPLHAEAVMELSAPAARRAAHGTLARLARDVEEAARHLALATRAPNEKVAAAVEAGARAAFARGSPAAAAALAERARALTPGVREAESRASVEAEYAFAAGDTRRAATLLESLVAAAAPGPERGRLLARQARLRHFAQDIEGSVELLREALGEAAGDDALRGEIEEGLAWGLLLVRRDLEQAAAHGASAARLADARGDRAARAEGLAAEAVTALVLGRPWRPAMERALADEDATLGLRVLRQPSFALGYCLSCADELDRARVVFTDLLGRAEAAGDESSLPSLLNHLTLIECLTGRWDEADRLADEGLARAGESGQLPTHVSLLAKRALVDARRGDHQAARQRAHRALELAGGGVHGPVSAEGAVARGGETALWALGYVELVTARPAEAAELIVPLARTLIDAGVREPGEVRCLPDAVEALLALSRVEEAEELLQPLEEWAEALGRPTSVGAARRCRGLLLAAEGDDEGALASLAAATVAYDGAGLPFEEARALLALGAQQRRARRRRAARETLGRASAALDALGAAHWAAIARDEIGRIGGRSPSPDGLTPAERRVAELVAEGRTNREVASELVVSVHTVESALTSIYRKLGVRSRTEMARRLADKE